MEKEKPKEPKHGGCIKCGDKSQEVLTHNYELRGAVCDRCLAELKRSVR